MADFYIVGDADLTAAQKKLDDFAKYVETTFKSRVQGGLNNALNINTSSSTGISKIEQAASSAGKTIDSLSSANLPRLRYALYDVSSTAQIASTSLLNVAGGAVDAAANYESAFVSVKRTAEVSGQQAEMLKQQIVAISEAIPVSFVDLTKLTTLGAQMGIPEANLANFTKVIAQFSAVTNVSAESAAQDFGKLANILGLSSSQYERFGSSIAYAGTKSAATESQIIATASQIGGVAKTAGYTADQVVGLSTAIASLGIAPEQARGALVRIFQEVNRSVLAGGTAIQNYASLLGMTTSEAQNLAASNMPEFFNRLVKAMSGMNNIQITQTLDSLGIKGVYATNVMSRLASNTDLVNTSMQNATQAFADGTYLTTSYGMVADTLQSKITEMNNAFTNLAAIAGDQLLPILKPLIDVAINIAQGFQVMLQSPIGQFFAVAGIAAAGLLGSILALVAGAAVFLGGTFAMTTALNGLISAGIMPADSWLTKFLGSLIGFDVKAAGASYSAELAAAATEQLGLQFAAGSITAEEYAVGLEAVAAGEYAVGGAAVAGAAGINILKIALIGSGIGAAVILLSSVAAAIVGANTATGDNSAAAADAAKSSQAFNDQLQSMNDQLNNVGSTGGGGSAGRAAAKIRTLTDYANDLSTVFSRAFDIRFSGMQTMDKISKSFSDIAKSTADARNEINSLNADIASLTADKALQEYFLSVATAYGDTLQASKIRANIAGIDSQLTQKNTQLQAAQDKTNKSLVGNTDAAISNRSEILGLVSAYQDHIKALASSGMNQEDLAKTTAQLKQDFIAQAKQLGYNSDELGIYTAAFDDVSVAIGNVPRNVTVEFNGDAALTAINEFVAKANDALGSVGGGGAGGGSALGGLDLSSLSATPAADPAKQDQQWWQKWDNISNWWNDFIANVSKGWNDFVSSMGKLIEPALKPIWDVLTFPKRLGEALLTDINFEQIWSNISTGFSNTMESLIPGWSDFWTNANTNIQATLDFLVQVWNDDMSAIAKGWNDFWAGAGAVASNVWSAVTSAFSNAVNWIESTWTSLWGRLSNFISTSIDNAMRSFQKQMPATFNVLKPIINWAFGKNYAEGGYTGAGGKYDVAGVVHKGEYVVPQDQVNQATKLPYFMEQPRSFSTNGYTNVAPSNMIVSLSPEDRALLRNVGGSGEVVLYANNEAIARSANAGNKTIVAAGGRP